MTQAVSLFELASAVVRLHERSAPGRISVVPVLVDDLAACLPVLQALSSVSQGRLLYAGNDELQRPVPATTDVVRRTAVEASLTTVPSGETRRVSIQALPGDYLDVTLLDPPLGADPSQGEKALLAFARAVCHQDLDIHEFAVIAFQDFAIDLPFRRAVWSLVVDQLADMPSSRLKTLVVVAESAIDVGLHCQTGRGFRFAVEEGRLLRRRGRNDLEVAATQIARHTGPIVLFLGAGFSASSRLPLGNNLRDGAIRRLLNIDPAELLASDELAIRFHQWISARDDWLTATEAGLREDEYVRTLTLEQVIRAEKRLYPGLPTLAEFRVHHDAVIGAPGRAGEALGAILEHIAGRVVVVEVNFDRLVETTSRAAVRPFFSDEQFESAQDYVTAYLDEHESQIPLLKLHGDIYEPETCVVSAEQTEQGVGAGKLDSLRALLVEPAPLWIYIGVSMRDQDLLPALAVEDFARGIDERWVNPYLVETIEKFAQGRLPFWRETPLSTIDDRLIAETADAFLSAWREVLGV